MVTIHHFEHLEFEEGGFAIKEGTERRTLRGWSLGRRSSQILTKLDMLQLGPTAPKILKDQAILMNNKKKAA